MKNRFRPDPDEEDDEDEGVRLGGPEFEGTRLGGRLGRGGSVSAGAAGDWFRTSRGLSRAGGGFGFGVRISEVGSQMYDAKRLVSVPWEFPGCGSSEGVAVDCWHCFPVRVWVLVVVADIGSGSGWTGSWVECPGMSGYSRVSSVTTMFCPSLL